MKQCDTCGNARPTDKFNPESFSPSTCFKCRISGVRMGYTAGKQAFHGDTLHGGTIASDNRHTVAEAKSNGYDPVPAGYKATGVSTTEINRLKKHYGV